MQIFPKVSLSYFLRSVLKRYTDFVCIWIFLHNFFYIFCILHDTSNDLWLFSLRILLIYFLKLKLWSDQHLFGTKKWDSHLFSTTDGAIVVVSLLTTASRPYWCAMPSLYYFWFSILFQCFYHTVLFCFVAFLF